MRSSYGQPGMMILTMRRVLQASKSTMYNNETCRSLFDVKCVAVAKHCFHDGWAVSPPACGKGKTNEMCVASREIPGREWDRGQISHARGDA